MNSLRDHQRDKLADACGGLVESLYNLGPDQAFQPSGEFARGASPHVQRIDMWLPDDRLLGASIRDLTNLLNSGMLPFKLAMRPEVWGDNEYSRKRSILVFEYRELLTRECLALPDPRRRHDVSSTVPKLAVRAKQASEDLADEYWPEWRDLEDPYEKLKRTAERDH